jgi:cellobiose transport system substrate-binding protein
VRYTKLKKVATVGVALITAGVALTGCSGNSGNGGASAGTSDSASTTQQITLTIGTFNNFGYDAPTSTLQGADLYQKYMDTHPNIKIEATVAAKSDDARSSFNTALGTGSGAYDIQAVDVDWMPDMIKNADKLIDLSDVIPSDRYQDWKTQIATTTDGKLIGAGTDIGPEAICYRSDLFAKAGLPTDRTEVAALLKGGWDKYFEIGQQFMAANTGAFWFDSMAATYQGMVNQIEASYIDPDSGDIIALDNADVKAAYDQLTAAAAQSAGLMQWSDDWSAGMKSDTGFATMLCPAWIINNMKNAAGEDFKGWDMADVFPGGGGDWGGSYLVIPTQSKNQEAAKDLVEWLTAPEQQVAVFAAASNYPSAVDAQQDSTVQAKTDAFLNSAPVGEIFANRAAAIDVVPYKGSSWFDIQSKMADALNRVDVDKTTNAADSWSTWQNDVKALA